MSSFDPTVPQLFLGNGFVRSEGGGSDIIDPATLEKAGVIAEPTVPEVERAIAGANAAQAAWAGLDAKTRAGLLHRVAESIERTSPRAVAELMVKGMGKPYAEAVGELANVAGIFRYCAEMARDEAGHVAGTTQPGSFQFSRWEPYGVSVHIMPYNFPILLFAWTAAASLAAGNGVIVKPAPSTALCTLKFMEHFAVLPAGLTACLPGGPEVAGRLIDSDATHVVAFTGGVETGRKVAERCGRLLKPAIIEAGGNDPLIVSDAAPLDVAVAGAVTAAFHLSGQICTSAERLYVHEKVHDRFVEDFVALTRTLRIGNGMGRTEIGPLASRAARDKVVALVEQAVAAAPRTWRS